ncbi:MAG TPA: RdgB/HAM1 family non-canonical purine NTP pyrophosphatase [Gammaproteobacteria bacterium]|nr:RdgB/HAM1 family non-canonical purine NTP pyrophosphatase [Gammaproteobacteria bacterium]
MSFPRRWVVATGNAGKLAEIRALLAGTGLELVAQGELGIEAAEEPGATFVENALIKARHAAGRSGLPAMADDSGLAVDALHGAPGIRSARYGGPGADDRRNLETLLAALEGKPPHERGASFHCVAVALLEPEDPIPMLAHGCWRGRIAAARAGANGFGYDPIFVDPLLGRTGAELSPAAKNEISHRAMAFRTLAALLRSREAQA